jgi:hypothetical protein
MAHASGRYSGRATRLGRWSIGFVLLTIWILGGPAIADWATPHFNVGGVWQYPVLLTITFVVAGAYWQFVQAVGPASKVD